MKPSIYRRTRRRTASHEAINTNKESKQDQQFFGETTHEPFFKPAMAMQQSVQRKCADCEKEDKVQRAPEKKEEEKVMKKEEKKEEKLQRAPDKKEEEKKVQKKEDKKEEEKVMKKEEKKEEDKVKKKEGAATSSNTATTASNYIGSINGKGQSMTASVQSFYENRIGADFSDVKIHTGKEAAESAKDINAQAYAYGNHIVFNEGKYQPETCEGKHLLAHELTHVVQQNAAGELISRAPDDGHDLTSSLLSGDTELEKCFDNEIIIRPFSKGGHVKKLQQGLMALGIPLPRFKDDGDYGSETIKGVRTFQEKAQMDTSEWDGIVGRKTIGLMDMSLRNSGITKDPDKAKDDFVLKDEKKKIKDESCKGKSADKPCTDIEKDIDAGVDSVVALIDKVESKQLPPVVDGKTDYPAVFNLLFRFNDTRPVEEKVKEVKQNYADTKSFVKLLKTDKSLIRCGTECDGGCRSGSPANHHFDETTQKHIITFCPDFATRKDSKLVLLHECHHAAVKGSRDIAYGNTRLVEKLDHLKALLNAATFHLYAGMVDDPTSVTIGPTVKDTNAIKDNTAKGKVDLALAFIQQWFRLVTFDISETVTAMEEANVKGHYVELGYSDIVNSFHKWFGITSQPAPPSKKDITKVKAIEERTNTMEDAFKQAFNIKESAGGSLWERGPGKEIQLNKTTTDLEIKRLVIALLQELVHATPDISAASEPLYVGSINDIRNRRALDPQ
ncbi:MAG: DUF4157 domain-containing protein [Ferruginibacter sp.]|nr:DUF4157 domain-containing protein [Ferruginibacter sp.]